MKETKEHVELRMRIFKGLMYIVLIALFSLGAIATADAQNYTGKVVAVEINDELYNIEDPFDFEIQINSESVVYNGTEIEIIRQAVDNGYEKNFYMFQLAENDYGLHRILIDLINGDLLYITEDNTSILVRLDNNKDL
jgi:hypothetical protein